VFNGGKFQLIEKIKKLNSFRFQVMCCQKTKMLRFVNVFDFSPPKKTKTAPEIPFFAAKTMSFVAQKHAFRSIKALLLSDKSNALIFRKIGGFCNRLIFNGLQTL